VIGDVRHGLFLDITLGEGSQFGMGWAWHNSVPSPAALENATPNDIGTRQSFQTKNAGT
jgi:hypothetical protein